MFIRSHCATRDCALGDVHEAGPIASRTRGAITGRTSTKGWVSEWLQR